MDPHRSPVPADLLPSDEPLPASQVVVMPRLTVVSHIYHQLADQTASGPPPTRYARTLSIDDEPYERKVKVGWEWTPLDVGWIAEHRHACALLSVTHTARKFTTRLPTPEEEEEVGSLRLFIAVEGPDGTPVEFCELRPGEECRLPPKNLDRYRVRSGYGETRYAVFAVPA